MKKNKTGEGRLPGRSPLTFAKDLLYDISVKLHRPNRKKARSMAAGRRSALIFYICILALPVLQLCVFYIGINVNTIKLAFQRFDYTSGKYAFNGLENFKEFITNLKGLTVLQYAVKNSAILYLVGLAIGLPLNLSFSYFLYKKVPMSGLFRVVLFLPQILSSIVMSLMFVYFVERGIPAIAEIFGQTLPSLLGKRNTTFPLIVFFCIWSGFGTQIIIYSTAMSGVDESLIEVGKLEGINGFQEFFRIVLPLIYPTITTFLVVGIAGFFTNQASLYNIYGQNAPEYTQTIGYYLFVQVVGSNATLADYPRASAAGILFTLIAAPLTLLVKHLLEKYGPSTE